MPSKRGYRAMGAALMETGRQVHLNRAEKLEQQKADNLHSIAQQRTDLMGEQNDIARQGQTDMAAYRDRSLDIQEDAAGAQQSHNKQMLSLAKLTEEGKQAYQTAMLDGQKSMQAAQSAEQIATAAWRQSLQENQTAATTLQLEREKNRMAAARVREEAMLAEAKRANGIAERDFNHKNLTAFIDKDIPSTITNGFKLKDLNDRQMYDTAVKMGLEQGAANFGKEAWTEYMAGLNETLRGSDIDPTTMDEAALKKVLEQLETKRDLKVKGLITNDQLATLVSHALAPEDTEAKAILDTGTGELSFSAPPVSEQTRGSGFRVGYEEGEESAQWMANVVDYEEAGKTVDDLYSDTGGFGTVMAQVMGLPNSRDDAIQAMSRIKSAAAKGDPDGMIAGMLEDYEANWDSYQRQYKGLGKMTFPQFRAKLFDRMGWGFEKANPQAGLMNTPASPVAPTPDAPGAGLMGGFASGNDYSGAV